LLAGYKSKKTTTKIYEDEISGLQKELRDTSLRWKESKQKLAEAEVELKKCRSGSSDAILGHFKTSIEKLTQEKDFFKHQWELLKPLQSEVKKAEGNLTKHKDIIKQQKKDKDILVKEVNSLKAKVKRQEREINKANAEVNTQQN